MIPVNTAEEFERWLSKMPQRNPKAYERLSGAGNHVSVPKAGPVEAFNKPLPAPPKESKDFKSAASGEHEDEPWDAAEPEET